MKLYSHSHRHIMPAIHGLINNTRSKVGNGLAVLLSDKIKAKQRQAVGWTLLGVGLLATIPLVITKFLHHSEGMIPQHAHHHGHHIPMEAHG